MDKIYDVIVIGGGAGGVPAAVRTSQLGGRVALVESEQLGGLCMNRGCIPFGHMMAASNILHHIDLGKEMGLSCNEIFKDYTALRTRQNELIDFMRLGVNGTLKKNKIDIIEGRGKIAGQGKVGVNGKVYTTKKIILATGGRWSKQDFPGVETDEVINSDDFLRMEEPPKRALLFGDSPWLIEIAQFIHGFGSQIILAVKGRTILSNESKVITSRLKRGLKSEGIDIKIQTKILAANRKKDGLHVELSSKGAPGTVVVDRLITIERVASLKNLGLRNINLDEDTPYLQVNRKMETETEGVYAIGDLTGIQSKHYSNLASEQGIIAAENAMGKDSAINPKTFSRVLYTQPQVVCVGLTSKEAKKAGYDVLVGTAPYSMNPLGMILSEGEGIVEVVAEKRYRELLGAHFIGTAASEMAGQAILAIQMEATLEDLSRVSCPHPTLSESLAEAARDALGKSIYLP